MFKTLSIAALISATATASFAGSLNNAPTQEVINTVDEFIAAPAGSSGSSSGIGVPAIVGGVVAAVAIGALIANSDSDDDSGDDD